MPGTMHGAFQVMGERNDGRYRLHQRLFGAPEGRKILRFGLRSRVDSNCTKAERGPFGSKEIGQRQAPTAGSNDGYMLVSDLFIV